MDVFKQKNDWMGFICTAFLTHLLQSDVEIQNGQINISKPTEFPLVKKDIEMPKERRF